MIHQSCNHAAVLRLAPGSLSKRMLGKLLFAILGGSLKQQIVWQRHVCVHGETLPSKIHRQKLVVSFRRLGMPPCVTSCH